MRIPSYLRFGSSVRVRATGDEPDISTTSPLEEVLNILFDDGSSNSASGPRNVEKLADSIARVKRDDRAKIKFSGRTVRVQLRNNQDVRLSGSAETSVRLRRP